METGQPLTLAIVDLWQPDEPLAATVTRADIALYAAKAAGRNRLATG